LLQLKTENYSFLPPFPILAVGTADYIPCVPSSQWRVAPSWAARGVTRPSRNGRNNSQPKRLADRQTQSIDQALVVGLVAEDPLTRIAPARDMLDGARVLDSQRPAHSSCLTLANVA